MNKTVSLAIRIVAILAAGGAGYFWYSIQSQNINAAMEKTKWFQTDKEVQSGSEFSQRMDAAAKLQNILREKRETIETVTAEKVAAEQMVAARDAKVAELNEEKNRLEGERAELLRKRDELVKNAREFENKAGQLQSELESATAQIARKTEQLAGMKTQEDFDAQVAKTDAAVDDKEKVVGRYTQLRNWTIKQGIVPPFGTDPTKLTDDAAATGSTVDVAPEKIKTKIVTIDRKNGLMAVTLGYSDKIESGKTYAADRDGVELGKVRVSEIRDDGLTILAILPDSNQALFNKDAVISLLPVVTTATPAATIPTTPPALTPEAAKAPETAAPVAQAPATDE